MTSIDFICIVNQERKRFGLRDSDFHKYRIHCTKKLKLLRKSTGLQQIDPKTQKFQRRSLEETHQTLLDYHHDDPSKQPNDSYLKVFLIELFQVEHSWASSRELRKELQSILKSTHRSSADQTPAHRHKSLSKLRHHSNQRLSKAIKHSDQLIQLCHSFGSLSIQSLAQVLVHKLYMKSLLELELDRWDSALDHLSIASVLLQSLANSIDQSAHKKRAIFYELMDEVTPMIRYCAYKSDENLITIDLEGFCLDRVARIGGIAKNLSHNDQVAMEMERFVETSRSIVHETIDFKWIDDQLIPIRSPELIDIITSVQKADQILLSQLGAINTTGPPSSSSKSNRVSQRSARKQRRQRFLQDKNPKSNEAGHPRITIGGFGRALSIYVEAETSLKALIEANDRSLESNSTIQRFDQQSHTLSKIYSIVGFRLLSTRVKRDLELVKRLERQLIKRELGVEDRIRKNMTNYRLIDRLVKRSLTSSATITSNVPHQSLDLHRQDYHHSNTNPAHLDHRRSAQQTDQIKSLLIKRRQAKIFPSLLKLMDDILFNLERIKQLKLIEEDQILGLKIDCKVSLFKAYRSLIQSKSYLLIDKYLESYGLQQKSTFYVRQTKMILEEIDEDDRMEVEVEGGDGSKIDVLQDRIDLSLEFLKFDDEDRARLGSVDDRAQDRLKAQIVDRWWNSSSSSSSWVDPLSGSSSQLESLTLADRRGSREPEPAAVGRPSAPPQVVFDLAFNYLTQFDSNNHSQQPVVVPSSSSITTTTTLIPTGSTDEPEPPPKSSGRGFWSFFGRG